MLDQLWKDHLVEDAADDPTAGDDTDDSPGDADAVGLWATLSVIGRHWKVVVTVLVLTVLACGAAFKFVPATFEANGEMILLSPTTKPDPAGTTAATNPAVTASTQASPTNPYLDFGSLTIVSQVLTTVMNGERAGNVITEAHHGDTFEVTNAPGDAPIIRITATGKTAEEATDTYAAVQTEAQNQLLQMQQSQGSSTNLNIRVVPLNDPSEATRNSGSRIRVLVAVVVLGVGLAALLAFAAEGLAQQGRLRRSPSSASPTTTAAAPPKRKRNPSRSSTPKSTDADTVDLRVDDEPQRPRSQSRPATATAADEPHLSSTSRVTSLFDRQDAIPSQSS
jgi:capsular polysaccharide biosynthesis protein